MIEAKEYNQPHEEQLKASRQDVSLLDLFIVLVRRKRFILGVTLVASVVTAVVVFLLPNQYTAETIILPPSQNSSAGSALIAQLGGSALASLAGANLGVKNPGDLYVSLLHTRTVEDAVIQRYGLMKRYRDKKAVDARKDFEDHAAVALGTKDGLIRIKVRDRDPKFAAEIANGYVEEFRKFSANLAITEASQRRLFFQQQLQEAKDNLANAEVAMKNTEQSTGVLQIDSQARALIESAATLRAQIVSKQVQIQGMRSFATEDNPEMNVAKQQLAALQAQLSKLGGGEQELNSDLVVPKGRIPEAGMEYLRKYRDVKYYETIYESIAKQFEIAKLDEAKQGSIIQVADVAVPPDRKTSPHRGLLILISAIAALILSSFYALAQSGFASFQQSPEQDRKLHFLREALIRGK